MTTSPITAPDMKPGYPSKGERIGPFWNALWHTLADHEWRHVDDLAGTATMHELTPKTASNMLRVAWHTGHLERRPVVVNGVRAGFEYRRPR